MNIEDRLAKITQMASFLELQDLIHDEQLSNDERRTRLENSIRERIHLFSRIGVEGPTEPETRFSHFAVELLLRDASALLDRCLANRKEHFDLAARAFDFGVDLDYFFANDELIKKEESEVYPIPESIENAEVNSRNAEIVFEEKRKQINDQITKYVKENSDNTRDFVSTAAKVVNSKIEGMWDYPKLRQPVDSNGAPFKVSTEATGDSSAKQPAWFYAETGAAYSFAFSSEIGKLERLVFESGLERDIARLKAEKSTGESNAKLKNLQSNIQMMRNNLDRFRSVSRHIASQEGGELDFRSRARSARRRLEADLSAAVQRLKFSGALLKSLYEYDGPDLNIDLKGTESVLDECVIRVQAANTWLTSFQDQQHSAAISISLRAALGDNFKSSLKSNKLRPLIAEMYFDNFRSVRLRSIGAQIVSSNEISDLSLLVQPPLNALYRKPSGEMVANVDQSHCRRIMVGGVRDFSSSRTVDLVSSTQIQNLSPIGVWEISFCRFGFTEVRLSDIDDVNLILNFVYV